MNFFELLPHVETNDKAIKFLRDRGVIASVPPRCPVEDCLRRMTEDECGYERANGGWEKMWRCRVHTKHAGLRMGSFLEHGNIAYKKFVLLAFLWAHKVPSTRQQIMLDVCHNSVLRWHYDLMDICNRQLVTLKKRKKIEIGGAVDLMPSKADEHDWRILYGKTPEEAFDNILTQIAHFFPVK